MKDSLVNRYVRDLEHPLKDAVELLRALILGAHPEVTEQIKWNAPSFCINGDDRITMNLRDKSSVQLVFHRGAKVKDATNFTFDDPSGLLTWKAKDRGMANFGSVAEVELKRTELADLAKRWMEATRD